MPRPMSFSDRQYLIQTLAQARNLTIACEQAQPHDAPLRKRCEQVVTAIDDVADELVGDSGYFKVVNL
jgi:hypothetical protein